MKTKYEQLARRMELIRNIVPAKDALARYNGHKFQVSYEFKNEVGYTCKAMISACTREEIVEVINKMKPSEL